MEKREEYNYKKLLKELKNMQIRTESHNNILHDYGVTTFYTERLIVSHHTIEYMKSDSPFFEGFSRRQESIDRGKEKRLESRKLTEKMKSELKDFQMKYPNATKEDKAAMKELRKIKNKYKDQLKQRENNVRRKIQTFKRLINANASIWTHFVTLTFTENLTRERQNEAMSFLEAFFRKMRHFDKDFKYVWVLEFQKRGAIHFHILCSIKKDGFVSPGEFRKIRTFWEKNGSINIKGINYKYNKLGKKILEQTEKEMKLEKTDDNEKNQIIWSVGNYLTSYLEKGSDDVFLFGKKMYSHSEDLKKPIVIKGSEVKFALKKLKLEELKETVIEVEQKDYKKNQDEEEIEKPISKIRYKYYNKLIKKD